MKSNVDVAVLYAAASMELAAARSQCPQCTCILTFDRLVTAFEENTRCQRRERLRRSMPTSEAGEKAYSRL